DGPAALARGPVLPARRLAARRVAAVGAALRRALARDLRRGDRQLRAAGRGRAPAVPCALRPRGARVRRRGGAPARRGGRSRACACGERRGRGRAGRGRGGLQLPVLVEKAAQAWLSAANIGACAYPMLTAGNASLLLAHGSPAQV